MKVYIIGAGPGDPELITVKGARLVETCPVVLYTGSLVPKAVVERAREDAIVLDSSNMVLEDIISVILKAKENDQDVARVHTGDPSIFGSTAEQIRKFDSLNIEYEIIPGVSSFTAAAATLGKELTLPEVSQTVIITRTEGRTPMPEKERLEILAQSGATLILFLSVLHIRKIVERLAPYYGEKCPVAVVQKATWPEQKVIVGTLSDIVEKVKEAKIFSTAIIFVGPVLNCHDFADSKLYSADFSHGFRKAKKNL
ncbi:precorrin-4 C(11)-methyltransferase [Leptospira santarosai]|uniref:precorrin-4 C(11)-methyltransferase n=1 Tax=Leptospira santarosai TaxID=28183 RepID=UPI000965C650|nr:precorrin-4 C(11)-methyltransferase [Leptospira santarosai]OLY62471.1 precorrin-4 C(11)-methyltransferase [Leptospira santarosai serovar Grippotyphosa]ONF79315.1 precorrin-4 C(11)-methyltransferase [Leptospira santarosai serovar Bananal]UZN09245.1 precorrin-4 C(11)-methyltransferase [Leptospira santarosai]